MPRLCDCVKAPRKNCTECNDGVIYECDGESGGRSESMAPETWPFMVNDQTVFKTFPFSTMEFQTIECVPSLNPAQKGEMDFHFYDHSVIQVNDSGYCKALDTVTGETWTWYTRPDIACAVTMAMKHKVGGYFYQFHKDGAITSNSKAGNYYWGPEELSERPENKRRGGKTVILRYWDPRDLEELDDLEVQWTQFMEDRAADTDHYISDMIYSPAYRREQVKEWMATQ